MSNNGKIEYKENFISKVKKIFTRDEEQHNSIRERNVKENKKKQDSFANEIKVDTLIKKNDFLKEIEGNEEELNMLSIDRLEKLERYYDDIIEQNNKKIKRLKISD